VPLDNNYLEHPGGHRRDISAGFNFCLNADTRQMVNPVHARPRQPARLGRRPRQHRAGPTAVRVLTLGAPRPWLSVR
jgi:hypothetical protein